MNKLSLLLGLGLMLVAIGCNRGGVEAASKPDEHASEAGHTDAEHGGDITLTDEAIKIAGIETEEARMMTIQGQLQVPGVITNTSQGRAVVTPPVDGKVVRILVRPGDRVRAGQAIASLQSADLATSSAAIIEAERSIITAEASVKEAASEIDLANGRLRSARAVLGRQQEFAMTGAFSQPALQEAQRDLSEAEAELETAKQDQAVHEAQLERAERLFKQELISRTELEEARLAVQQDRTHQQRAQKQIGIAQAAYDREKRISERGLQNSREIQAAEADVRAALLEVQKARIRKQAAIADLAGAKKGVQAARAAYTAHAGGSRAAGGTVTVMAPISGVVVDLHASLGQAVERTTELCEIENLHSVWVTANVPEKEIAKAAKGSRTQVTVKAFPHRIFYGVVQVVGVRLDPKTRTMPVQVLVENADGALRSDMFATVSLGVGGRDVALAVKRTAIVEDGDKRILFIAEDGGKFEERLVELGRVQGDFVEIVSGLETGVKVVVKAAFVLKSEKIKSELKGHED